MQGSHGINIRYLFIQHICIWAFLLRSLALTFLNIYTKLYVMNSFPLSDCILFLFPLSEQKFDAHESGNMTE